MIRGLGVDGTVNGLVVFDDGTGEALYASGEFETAGGRTASRVARWDGVSWSALTGPMGNGIDGDLAAMTRLRISSTGVDRFGGAASVGEVEDYEIEITPVPTVDPAIASCPESFQISASSFHPSRTRSMASGSETPSP
jgi:hypothetical protein